MTFGPLYYKQPTTVEQAYHNVRYSLEQLEQQLAMHDSSMDEEMRKRSDKAVTVMKVGIKIIKKAFGLKKNLQMVA